MKQFLLATVLIAIPVAGFTAFQVYLAPASTAEAAQPASLGDLSSLKAIILDVQGIVKTGDLKAAETRITDFETAWDQAEATMRPKNKEAWATVDDAADAALHALRSKQPDAATVNKTLADLVTTLDNPYGDTAQAAGGVKTVAGIAVTDESGHPLACETMLKSVQAALDGGKIPAAKVSDAKGFQDKALERCNADDDAHADEFSAQALALANQ